VSRVRLRFVMPCVAAVILGTGAAMAGKRDGRHAGHLPRVSTATYTMRARSHARVLRMTGVQGARYAQEHRHGLMRGS